MRTDATRIRRSGLKSLPQLPDVIRMADAQLTADANREPFTSWALKVASLAGDETLEPANRQFAQKMALLLAHKLIPNAASIDQIDRVADKRMFKELAGMTTDELLRMARVTPQEGIKAALRTRRVPDVLDVADAMVGSATLAAEVESAREALSQRPHESATCHNVRRPKRQSQQSQQKE